MRVLFKLDDLILGKVERAAHYIQRLTGKNNFQLARIIMFVYVFCIAGETVQHIREWGELLISLILVIGLAYQITLNERLHDGQMGRFKNFMEIHPLLKTCRIFLCVVLLVSSILFVPRLILNKVTAYEMYLRGDMLAYVAIFYLIACTPLPPSENKTRSWFKIGVSKKTLAPATRRVFVSA